MAAEKPDVVDKKQNDKKATLAQGGRGSQYRAPSVPADSAIHQAITERILHESRLEATSRNLLPSRRGWLRRRVAFPAGWDSGVGPPVLSRRKKKEKKRKEKTENEGMKKTRVGKPGSAFTPDQA